MENNKISLLVSLVVLIIAFMLFTPTIASAQYSDEVTDSTGDVKHWRVTDTGSYGWRENVERPNVDIVRTSIDESAGELNVELEVKGTIQSDAQEDSFFMYVIEMEDGDGESYDITYSFGQIYFEWPGGTEYGFTEPAGFGTSTLQVSFLLEEYGNPDSLEISSVTTYEYTGSAGTGEYYMDEASPGSDGSNGDGSSGDLTDEEKDMLDKLWAGSMLCIALAIIIPIVIVVIIIIVLIKVIGGDKDEGQPPQQPPQQGYQQGPPPGQPPAQQQQPPQQQDSGTPPPPPQESGSEGDEW